MTQEEKAKAYDEVREKIALRFGSNVAEEIFSKFEDSDDERIRKELIELIGCMHDADPRKERWLSWLEKQRERPMPIDIDRMVYKYGNTKEDCTNGLPVNCQIRAYRQGINDTLNLVSNLEKQGEQKVSYSTLVETGDGGINALVTKELPTNGCDDEQKPADKVESHFRVEKGKWYMCIKNNVGITQGNVYYGISDGYIIDDNGRKYNCNNWAVFQRYLRLWDITKDAKDGDVLVSQYNNPFIYNGNHDSLHIGSYCGISVEDRFNVATEKCHWTENANIHPATKEQRELLLKKMREAGYEWDAEKKGLKLLITNGGDFDSKNCVQNNEWGEEDEAHINSIIDYLLDYKLFVYEEDMNVANGVQKELDWLQSIKEKNTWKPSDEQIAALSDINITGSISYPGQGQELINLYSDLKKLKG